MMDQLKALVIRHDANTRPADADSIASLQATLDFALAPDYVAYLSGFGVIVYGSNETYGLGVPDGYYLNVLTAYQELRADPHYPAHALPLLDIGDGHYYLYDNLQQKPLRWAMPNGGVVAVVDEPLESFLMREIFARG